MKCKYTDGCVCTSLAVDGKRTMDMTNEELKGVIAKMLDKVKDSAVLQKVWTDIMECVGDYEDGGACETCGDHIVTYTLEI